jgi:hypothetical protein
MGPGDHPFTRFGHDALLVEDTSSGSTLVYNYGTFVFDSPWLAIDFLRGRLQYWLSVSPLHAVVRHYAVERRSIAAQELRIEAAERLRIANFLARTERSSARFYKYDYYRDNCGTRLRDLLDGAIGGRLRAASLDRAPLTYREETLRSTAEDVPLSLGLDVAMGPLIDRPLTVWESEFLPARLADAARSVRVPGPAGDVPFVVAERVLLAAPGRTVRATPPNFVPRSYSSRAISACWASTSASRAERHLRSHLRHPAHRASGWSRDSSQPRCVLLASRRSPIHAVTFQRESCSAPVQRGAARSRSALAPRCALRRLPCGHCHALALGTSILALALAALPWFGQKNLGFVGLMLPIWLGTTVGLSLLSRGRMDVGRTT